MGYVVNRYWQENGTRRDFTSLTEDIWEDATKRCARPYDPLQVIIDVKGVVAELAGCELANAEYVKKYLRFQGDKYDLIGFGGVTVGCKGQTLPHTVLIKQYRVLCPIELIFFIDPLNLTVAYDMGWATREEMASWPIEPDYNGDGNNHVLHNPLRLHPMATLPRRSRRSRLRDRRCAAREFRSAPSA